MRYESRPPLACAAALVCWLLAATAAASGPGVLDGELGRWVDRVGPELGRTLAGHPRFKGETIRLVAATAGPPDAAGNELADAVVRGLRDHVLKSDGVRLAVDGPRHDCEPPQPVDYLVRVEVADAGGQEGRVHVAVVDVAESVWVSGISYEWRGRLSAAQRRALTTTVNRAGAGTAGSPIAVTDAAAVAAAMADDLACTLPRDLSGALFVAAPEIPVLSPVALALQGALSYRPLAAVTPQRDQAGWLLSLDMNPVGAGMGEVNLTLADAAGGSRQRLASVFVTGLPVPAAVATTPPAVPPTDLGPDAAPVPSAADAGAAELLSALEMHRTQSEGSCDFRRARVNACVDVAFDLRRPAYLFVVTTRGHQVVDAPCSADLQAAQVGAHRYRLRVPPGGYAVNGGGPDAGIYILAARDRGVAAQLQDVMARAPGRCDSDGGGASEGWLDALRDVLARNAGRVSWRAMQFAQDSTGVVVL